MHKLGRITRALPPDRHTAENGLFQGICTGCIRASGLGFRAEVSLGYRLSCQYLLGASSPFRVLGVGGYTTLGSSLTRCLSSFPFRSQTPTPNPQEGQDNWNKGLGYIVAIPPLRTIVNIVLLIISWVLCEHKTEK